MGMISDGTARRGQIKYHGLTGTAIEGAVRVPFFLADDPTLAKTYTEDNENPTVLAFEDLSTCPLILDTAAKFIDAWRASGAGDVVGTFHPDQTAVFSEWARLQGHDAIVIPESAFEDEIGYEEVGGRFGEAQTIILDPRAVRRIFVY